MSGAMEEAMRREALGINKVPDTNCCAKHINEAAVQRYIKKSATRGYCDYCERMTSVIELNDLVEFLMGTIGEIYSDPADFIPYESSEGGYLWSTYDSQEVLQDQLGFDVSNNLLYDDIFNSLDPFKLWADVTKYHGSPSDIMLYSWNYFKKVVKNRSRYFFGLVRDFHSERFQMDSNELFNEIGKSIKKFRLVKVVPEGARIYRCRQHKRGDMSVNDAAGMTSPPVKYAVNSNRMSPSGISMFYGAFEKDTAIIETLDTDNKDDDFYTTVQFILKRDINIVDFSVLPDLPSPFDKRKRQARFNISFIKDFVKDFVAPIDRDGRIHINYVPTQIITEYFRFPFSDAMRKDNRIEGIIYPSSRDGKKACVLFFDNQESLEVLDMDAATSQTTKVIFP